MSLLDRWNTEVTVYPAETYTDSDGNTLLRPGTDGTVYKAWVWPKGSSGTSNAHADTNDEGEGTQQDCKIRFRRVDNVVLSAQSRIDWNGEYWSVFGFPSVFNGSPRTARNEYQIRRN